jgi:uncharacterized protein YfeS
LSEEFNYDDVVKEIKKLQQKNISKVQALANSGKAIDPGALANIKIDTFIETFLDQNAQAAFVLKLEQRIQETLDEALALVRQEQLTQGTPAQSGSGLFIAR